MTRIQSNPELRQVEFDPGLMEAVVTRALAQHVTGPSGFNEQSFHAESDPIYAIASGAQQAAKFRELYARWFRRGQFDQPFLDALAELPEVDVHVSRVTVTSSPSSAEERADLAAADSLASSGVSEHPSAVGRDAPPIEPPRAIGLNEPESDSASGAANTPPPGLWLGISVQPVRFMDRPRLRRWLRHELWHIRDMLDPAFQYRREDFTAGPAERLPQRVVQERYGLLWSLSIDARVQRAGLLPLHTAEERLARIAGYFPGFSHGGHREILESIGTDRGLSHPELLQLARSPQGLCRASEQTGAIGAPLRGSACPLCHFPTFHWADLSQPRAAPVIDAIHSAYPQWDRELGACSTCFDLFSIRGGIWA